MTGREGIVAPAVREDSSQDWRDSPSARRAARLYASLEDRMRAAIDPVAAKVCPSCASPCCRHHYCRATARNPWYAFVNRVAGAFEVPEDWERRRDAFGLGRGGCEIRAGRYVYCYSYNCPRMLAAVPTEPARQAFEELSDLLLAANRLPDGRLLHELGPGNPLTADHLRHIEAAAAAAAATLRRASCPPSSFGGCCSGSGGRHEASCCSQSSPSPASG